MRISHTKAHGEDPLQDASHHESNRASVVRLIQKLDQKLLQKRSQSTRSKAWECLLNNKPRIVGNLRASEAGVVRGSVNAGGSLLTTIALSYVMHM